jgi:dihydroxy-acid dehydratase
MAGERIVELVRAGVTTRRIVTRESLENAIRVDMALGGSTNTTLHIPAIAHAAEVDVTINDFDRLSRQTPQLTSLRPSGEFMMEDLEWAGGIPAVLKSLGSLLNTGCQTVCGRTVREILDATPPGDTKVIHTVDSPIAAEGGIAVLRGSLAPDGAVVKRGAVAPSMLQFTGTARVFEDEDSAMAYLMQGKVKEKDILIVRYEGPKGGPGMREMYKPMKLLYGRGLSLKTALVTDGRFSGTNNGCFVGHVSPEAAEGGPLAIVQDGDLITIDIPNRRLELHVPDDQIKARLTGWKRPEPKFTKGYLALYSRLAESADKGAIIRHKLV